MKIQWKDGFVRLWIAASALWVIVLAWLQFGKLQLVRAYFVVAQDEQQRELVQEAGHRFINALQIIFLPPLSFLILGVAVAWIVKGFFKNSN